MSRAASPLVRRLLVTVALAVAAGGFVYAASLNTGDEEVVVTDGAVERFIPADGATLGLRQGQIGVDLAPSWAATLSVNGTPIPDDQLNCFDDCFEPRRGQQQQDVVFFQPGPGKVIEELPGGRSCATATLWRPAFETPEDDGRSVSWCFRVA